MYFIPLNVCTKNEVCRFSWIWNIDICMEKTKKTSPWRHHPFDFYEIPLQKCIGHIAAVYQISVWSSLRELRHTVEKLTENYGEKMDIVSLWPWPLTQGHQFQKGLSQCGNRIGAFVRLEFRSKEKIRHSHTQRHTHRQTAVKI